MEPKKGCELCRGPARMYCESDEASLCWDCDERVHSANFLVAKHSRRLLCHVCQSLTPWAAAGPKFGPTISVCDSCFNRHGKVSQAGHREEGRGDVDNEEYSVNGDSGGDDGDEEDELDDEYDGDDDDVDEDDDGDEDGDNQVVPWSCDLPLPPAASSSSSGEESAAAAAGVCLGSKAKRVWDVAFSNDSDDEVGCASSQVTSRALAAIEEPPSSACFQPVKQQRRGGENPEIADRRWIRVHGIGTNQSGCHNISRETPEEPPVRAQLGLHGP